MKNLDKYKDQLLTLQNRFSNEVARLLDAMPDEIVSPGSLSKVPTHNADQDAEMFETDVEFVRNEQDLRDAVQAALARIADGTYGVCERCGDQISTARLNAVPYTP